jgi:hypothetical protein
MDNDARLVVACSASIHATIAYKWLKGFTFPLFGRPGGLDVMVGVEQNCRSAIGGRYFAEDRRMGSFDLEGTDRLAACRFEKPGGEIC